MKKKPESKLEEALKFWGVLILVPAVCYFLAGICHWMGGT